MDSIPKSGNRFDQPIEKQNLCATLELLLKTMESRQNVLLQLELLLKKEHENLIRSRNPDEIRECFTSLHDTKYACDSLMGKLRKSKTALDQEPEIKTTTKLEPTKTIADNLKKMVEQFGYRFENLRVEIIALTDCI